MGYRELEIHKGAATKTILKLIKELLEDGSI